LNTADNIDTTAHAVQKAVHTVTLNSFFAQSLDFFAKE
jgi:hypothetical protein